MAAHHVNYHPPGPIMQLLALWSFAQTMVHSAGCVVNDIADREIDALVGTQTLSFVYRQSQTDHA